MTGVGEVVRRMNAGNQKITNNIEAEVVRMGAFIEDEVKESLAGNRAEHQSVDTGTLIKSIKAKKVGNMRMMIAPERKSYSGAKTTTEDTAAFMEYSKDIVGGPRAHFKHTEKRNAHKIQKEIEKEVKKGVTWINR